MRPIEDFHLGIGRRQPDKKWRIPPTETKNKLKGRHGYFLIQLLSVTFINYTMYRRQQITLFNRQRWPILRRKFFALSKLMLY